MAKKGKQKICPICDEKLSFLKSTIKDGIKVCVDHTMEAGLYGNEMRQFTVEDVKERAKLRKKAQEETMKRVSDFQTTKRIGPLHFNDIDKKILIYDNLQNSIVSYEDIVSFEVMEDGETISSGGLGRALVGGVLFGGAGAVVGAVTAKRKKKYCNNLQVKLIINDINTPTLYVSFINGNTKINSNEYKSAYSEAQDLASILQIICDKQKEITNDDPIDHDSKSLAKKMKQFKELLDDGIITQEEFDKKKKELLDL